MADYNDDDGDDTSSYNYKSVIETNEILEAQEILAKDNKSISDFQSKKFINEAPKMWDLFYKRHTVNFFKDRHWTDREFPELAETGTKRTLLEIGCGVGNFVFPMIERNPDLFIYACDFSSRAVQFVKSHEQYDETRCKAFVCDLTADKLVDNVAPESLDLISAIFCLSAIPPSKLQVAVGNLATVMKKGGLVLFRDYGLYDAAQLRFKPGHRMDENFYVRQDGTFSVYFTIDQLNSLFTGAGFEVVQSEYVEKEILNRKTNTEMHRRWAQAKFRKI